MYPTLTFLQNLYSATVTLGIDSVFRLQSKRSHPYHLLQLKKMPSVLFHQIGLGVVYLLVSFMIKCLNETQLL